MLKYLTRRIGVRLFLSYLFISLLTLGLGIVSWILVNQINTILVSDTTIRSESRYLSTELRVQVLLASALVESYPQATSDTQRQRIAVQLADEAAVAAEFSTQLASAALTSEEQQRLSQILPLVQDYYAQGQHIAAQPDQTPEELALALANFRALRSQVLENLSAYGDTQTSLLYTSQRTARQAVTRAAAVAAIASAAAIAAAILLGWVTTLSITRPVDRLTKAASAFAQGDLDQVANVRSQTEIGLLAQVFNHMAARLKESIGALELRVADRTQSLEKRATQLQAAAEVGRAAATIRDQDHLLKQIALLISDRFGFYHVGIFLTDEAGEYAVLRAANSQGGQQMLAQKHRLKLGETGIVGRVTAARKPHLALDVGTDAYHFKNPLLPDTRSEMALPLVVGDRLLGALDVQSVQESAFSEEDFFVFQVLADQVAVAIENTYLFAENKAAVAELQKALEYTRRSSGEYSRTMWQKMLASKADLGYVVGLQTDLRPAPGQPRPELLQTMQLGQTQRPADLTLVVPIRIRDLVVGALRLNKPPAAGPWTEEESALMETLADQLGIALENARSYEDTQLRAERERILSDITSKVRSSTDVSVILQTAVQELAEAPACPAGSHRAARQ
jgi:nitrate/nitrite-specific signal transduction histidine kinase